MTDNDNPDVTIVVTPRERFGVALESLQSIYDNTTVPFRLVYVNGGGPRALRRQLASQATARGFDLIQTGHHLSPNQARNLGLAKVSTSYVAFVDNDLIVTKGWLERLLMCAEETNAALVGPLYFEGDPKDRIIHMAGGDYSLDGPFGQRSLTTVHRHQSTRLNDAPPLARTTVDFVEFHCLLARTYWIGKVGGLDVNLLSTREHLDLCMAVAEAGGHVYFEPQSEVTYTTPPPVDRTDIPFYLKRWSESWNRVSLEHFSRKHGLDPSYVDRIVGMRARRQILLSPFRRVIKTLPGPAASFMTRAIERCERELNSALVRTPRYG